MTDISALTRQRADLITDAENVLNRAETEGRDLSSEERDAHDALLASIESLNDRIQRAEKTSAVLTAIRSGGLSSEPAFGAGINVNIKRDPFENLDRLDPTENGRDVIARAVTAMSEVQVEYVTDADRQAVVALIERIPGVAVHALMHGSPAYRSAFETWGKAGMHGQMPLYSAEEQYAVRSALSLGGSTGGYMLPTLFDPTLIHTGTATRNPLRTISRVVQTTQNVWHGVSVGNVTSYWTAEAGDFTEGNPTFANPTVTAAKLTAYLPGSYEIFEDMTQMSQLPGLIGESFDYTEQSAFISGSGSGAPKGIITAISATAGSTVTVTTRGSFTTASSVDVYALVNSVTPRYEMSATWVGNKATFNLINQMAPQGGGSLYWGDLNSPTLPRPPLLGYPTLAASSVSAAYTSGTAFMVLGDFNQFLIVDRIGTTVEFAQNLFNNTTGLPTGSRALIAHKRVGSDVTDINAFRFLKG